MRYKKTGGWKIVVSNAPVVLDKQGQRCFVLRERVSSLMMHLNFGNRGGRSVYSDPVEQDTFYPISSLRAKDHYNKYPRYRVFETAKRVTVLKDVRTPVYDHSSRLNKRCKSINLAIVRSGPSWGMYDPLDEEERQQMLTASEADWLVSTSLSTLPFECSFQYIDGSKTVSISYARFGSLRAQKNRIKLLLSQLKRQGTIIRYAMHVS